MQESVEPYRQQLYDELERKVRHWAIIKESFMSAPKYRMESECEDFIKVSNQLDKIYEKIKSSAFQELKKHKNVEFFLDDDEYMLSYWVNSRTTVTDRAYICEQMFGIDVFSRLGRQLTFMEAKEIFYQYLIGKNYSQSFFENDYITLNLQMDYLFYNQEGALTYSKTKPEAGEYMTKWGLFVE